MKGRTDLTGIDRRSELCLRRCCVSRGQPGGVKAELTGGKWSLGGGDLIAGALTRNVRGLMPNYAAPLPAMTAAVTWSRARFGEDEDSVGRARSSAMCAK